MTLHGLVLRYVSFAVLATLVNLATQRLILARDQDSLHFAAAVGAGTLAGLVVKYVLDKRWIFDDRSTGARSEGRKFTLYTAMGLITTAIFWGTETAFWLIWRTEPMREVGALLGLACGYVIKFQLDRRFVFTDARLRIDRAA